MAYYFRVGPLLFILNVQQSTIGFSYPRIFIAFPDNSYLNCDLTLGALFAMTENDWFSWLDGTEIHLDNIDTIREICAGCGVNWDVFEEWAFEAYDKHKGEN